MTITVISDNTTADYNGCEDAYMAEDFPTSAFGADDPTNLSIYNFGSGDHKHALVRFTGLTNIASSQVVSDAYESLYMYDGDSGTHTIDLRRCLRAWVEAQVTWLIYAGISLWGTAGGTNSSDRVDTVSASNSAINTTTGYKDFTGTGIDTDTQNMVNLSAANEGWFHKAAGADTSQYKLFSSSDSTDGERPKLTVTHAAGARPPKPTIIRQAVHRAASY